ncbi:MAG: hypothetical protein HQ518_03670 [Rhodopirellula sp.]|nr:hypothetical protein [Rhodopirellula sp.]
MTDPRIDLRNPVLAAALAFLFPGAGHVYQRRYFKAAIYSVCVLGIYFWGCSLGEAKAVHFRWDESAQDGQSRQRTIGYLAQVGVGLPALPAVVQELRYSAQREAENSDRQRGEVLEQIDADFTGKLNHVTLGHADITGRISGVVRVGDYGFGTEFEGTFVGQNSDGTPLQFNLLGSRSSGSLQLGDRVTGLDNITMSELVLEQQELKFSGDRRRLFVRVVDKAADLGMIEGTIPRPFYNHYLAPLDDESLQYLNGKLGKQYELALVYTWIAGLLNILAVWDALQGPAYGYGDEEPETDADDKASEESSDEGSDTSQPAAAAAGVSS